MATRSFYLVDGRAPDAAYYLISEVAPPAAAFSPVTGWVISNAASGTASSLVATIERAVTTFAAPVNPAFPNNTTGNGFRSDKLYGRFDAGNWTFALASQSVSTSHFGSARYRWRVFKSPDPTGTTNVTEYTSGDIVSGSASNWSTFNAPIILSGTWAAPQVDLSDEYLFFTLSCESLGGGFSGSYDLNLFERSTSLITTGNWVPGPRFADATPVEVITEIPAPTMGRVDTASSVEAVAEIPAPQATPVFIPSPVEIVVEVPVPTAISAPLLAQPVEVVVEVPTPKLDIRQTASPVEVIVEVPIPRLIAQKSRTELIMDEFERERQMLMGARGNLKFVPRLFLSDSFANELTELPGVLNASVNLDNNRDYTWELKLDCLPTDAFDPIRDWVLVALDVSCDLDPPKRYYLGLYRFDFPRGSDEPEGSLWQLTGMSPEFLLMRDNINELFPVSGGSFILQLIRNIITTRAYFPTTRLTLPWAEDLALPFASTFGGGTNDDAKTWLELVNKLLGAGGFHHLQTDNLGSPVARKIRLPANSAPSIFYGPREREIGGFTGNDMLVYTAISREPDYGKFANEYTVISAENEQQGSTNTSGIKIPPARATVRNTDPKNPISIPSLGYVISKEETLDQAVNVLVCNLIARRRLMEASSFANSRQIVTMLDPRRTYDEIYLCEATNGRGAQIMDGRWQCINWNIPLPVGGAPDVMTHKVGRDELVTELEEL